MASKCKTCGSELMAISVPAFAGKDGPVVITFSNLPILACPHGHEKRMVDTEFPLYVLQTVTKNVPMSSLKGFTRKQHVCNKCSTPLDQEHPETARFEVRLSWKETQPFGASLDGPSAKCSSCMTLQLIKTAKVEREEIPNAIVNAFESIQLKR